MINAYLELAATEIAKPVMLASVVSAFLTKAELGDPMRGTGMAAILADRAVSAEPRVVASVAKLVVSVLSAAIRAATSARRSALVAERISGWP